ncbi:putative TIR domain-containing protein [Rosa chinensis]|uniref:Putative TIR domain-containing protein n=1 Tax=Rosa chinensis TaxID=74649 RepID=A0A2P6PS83_ROSCH|nr:uncharacterized protein LOC112170257 [Rosa chinensis]PRQ24782.1 putative TIR domain-containing protein [Rosa chinensis]
MVLNKRRVSIPLRISIPLTSLWACDVFLSCDHEDIFSDHLYHKLKSRGICTFQDGQLSRGICTFQDGQQLQRNTTPQFAIVVLSQNYASSPQRLNELSKILECIKDRNRILPVFRDVNLFHVQKQKGTFEKAFEKHEERFQDDLEKVQAWRDALTQVCNFAGWTTNDRNEVQVIEEITEALWNKLHSRLSPTEKLHPTSTHNLVAFTSISVNEDNHDHNHPINITDVTATSVEWNFLITSLGLEILSAAFDQASSSSEPHYALFGMLFSIAALFTCIWELIYKGIKNRVVLKKFGKLWWFYYPHPHTSMPFGTLPEIYGLIGSIAQCICSITQYIYFSWHADSPIKLSLLPAIFLFCLAGSRLNRNQNHC